VHWQERFRRLKELEREHRWFAVRAKGWSPWRVLRHFTFNKAMALPFQYRSRPLGRRLAEAFGATLRFTWVCLFPRRVDLLVKTCRSALRIREGETFRDIYFDGLLHAGRPFFKLEEINVSGMEPQAARARFPGHLNPVFFTFWGKVLGKMFPLDVRTFCEEVASECRARLGIQLDPGQLVTQVSSVHWQARLYGCLLDRLRPRAILVSDTGEYGLNLAAGRRGIRFVELQHGVFDDQHPDAVPLEAEGSRLELLLPDVLACKGHHWIDQLRGSRQGTGCAVPVGNEQVDDLRSLRKNRCPSDPLTLLVTSQGLDSKDLVEWLLQVARCAPPGLDFRIQVKLHPIYDPDPAAYTDLAAHPRMMVIPGAATPSFYDLLVACDIHGSISSACHFEALAVGVPTVVIPLAGHEAMLDQVRAGRARLARTPEEFWSFPRREEMQVVDQAYFSEPDFHGNFERLLQ